tara:strand:+ start:921 stop:1949 length:1029 start_codon:yes stop_codon:yes gene_type:complete
MTHNIKVGDKVRLTSDECDYALKGAVGTVTAVDGDCAQDSFGVRFSDDHWLVHHGRVELAPDADITDDRGTKLPGAYNEEDPFDDDEDEEPYDPIPSMPVRKPVVKLPVKPVERSSKLIGLVAPKQSGKDTASEHMVQRHDFTNLKFAQPLKDMIRSLLASAGYKNYHIEDFIEGKRREEPLPIFGGKSVRYMMQSLGTEWGRNLLCADVWLNIMRSKIESLPDNPIVISDVSFDNEADMVRSMGGDVVRIQRDAAESNGDTHASEGGRSSVKADLVIRNNDTVDNFISSIDYLVEGHNAFDEKVAEVAELLQENFSWANTPQGHEYWAKIQSQLHAIAEGR